jgi:indolepyruvate ferredoxin oxidoreductase beta subunit
MNPINFLLVGVGGQGILTASDILAELGLRAGYDVKKSEVHGMSQRGGAVSSHVRFGPRVYSPLIAQGEVDFLLSFEQLEALRWVSFLRPEGVALVSTQHLPPIAVTSGGQHYPTQEEVCGEMTKRVRRMIVVDAPKIARELGNPRVANTVLLGAMSALLPFPPAQWEATIRERMPARFVELNLKALHAGQDQVKTDR